MELTIMPVGVVQSTSEAIGDRRIHPPPPLELASATSAENSSAYLEAMSRTSEPQDRLGGVVSEARLILVHRPRRKRIHASVYPAP